MEADFAEYYNGLDLADMWRRKKNGEPKLTTRRAAVLLCYLPRAARVWQHVGGGMSWTAETEAVYILEHNMNMQAWGKAPKSKRGKKPDMRPYPEALFAEDQKRQQFEKNAAAWRRKYGKPNPLA